MSRKNSERLDKMREILENLQLAASAFTRSPAFAPATKMKDLGKRSGP